MRNEPTIHRYDDYGWLRGFNVIPSWAARIEQAWWDYDAGRFREEIALATQAHANCIRLWIEFTAWMADPEAVTAAFHDAIAAIGEHGMKAEPCLYNRWHNLEWDYGGTYILFLNERPRESRVYELGPQREYLQALVTPLARDDRVLMWDLCNEPRATSLDDPMSAREVLWLTQVADTVRATGAQQPITIGTTWLGANLDIYAPLCDVLGPHFYAHTPEDLAAKAEQAASQQKAHHKPMHCNEGIPGSLNDRRRAEVAKFHIKELESRGWGWIGWGMREGKAVSTRRDRVDTNGIDGEGFHAWFTAGGELRPGLEFLQEPPSLPPPWVRRP